MRRIMQNLKDGATFIEELPHPSAKKHHCVIRSSCSLVSPGTEKMLIRFGKAGWIEKLRQQPDKVGQVLEKIQHEGLLPTLEAVQRKMDQPVALGYSNVGIIETVGTGVHEFKLGERVVSNGYHADFNVISENLMCRIPDAVPDETAAFTMLGAIALQGIRLIQPEIGERVVVLGLGLIGQLACQILHANGCKVFGMDPSSEAREKAGLHGVECLDNAAFDGEALLRHVFDGEGADAVLITASSDEALINEAAKMCRQRGRVVLVGVVANQLNRDYFYKKEIRFQVACSYGPGRYDMHYEEQAIDYPIGLVRWTEKRNMQAVLELMEKGVLRTEGLIQMEVGFEDAIQRYYQNPEQLKWGNLIRYSEAKPANSRLVIPLASPKIKATGGYTIGYFGSGSYSASTLLPALGTCNVNLDTLCSSGPDAGRLAKKFGFSKLTAQADEIWNNDQIDFVCIANRHHNHAGFVVEALKRGKHVFVEKPLALSREELHEIRQALDGKSRLVVGYNRAFSSHISRLRSYTDAFRDRLHIQYQINAGYISPKSWLQDADEGGGRIIGELCHFVDLCAVLTGSEVVAVHAEAMGKVAGGLSDTISVLLRFANGSLASISYFSNGPGSYQKETLQVFFASKMLELNNFRSLRAHGLRMGSSWWPKYDKGHQDLCKKAFDPETKEFGEPYLNRIFHTSEICFQIVDCLRGINQGRL